VRRRLKKKKYQFGAEILAKSEERPKAHSRGSVTEGATTLLAKRSSEMVVSFFEVA
jgi:hypothetical protein